MNKYSRFFVTLLFTGLMTSYAGVSQAECSYGQKIGEKSLRTLTNMTTGLLEVPKNIINVTNESNVFYGFTGGTMAGLLNFVGRLGVGLADLLSLPIPTKPVAHPIYIWDDYDVDTSYGDLFRLDTCPEVQPVATTPVVQPVVAPVVAPRAPAVDRSGDYKQQTNRKLDTMFKKEMMK